MIRFKKLGILRSIIPLLFCIHIQLWMMKNPIRNFAKGMLSWAERKNKETESINNHRDRSMWTIHKTWSYLFKKYLLREAIAVSTAEITDSVSTSQLSPFKGLYVIIRRLHASGMEEFPLFYCCVEYIDKTDKEWRNYCSVPDLS